MRWFKHMTDASDDPFLQWVLDEYGVQGYGWHMLLLELIAGQGKPIPLDATWKNGAPYPPGATFSIVTSWRQISRKLRTKSATARQFLVSCRATVRQMADTCPTSAKIILTENGDMVRLDCPNLLKIRDEYSQKLGRNPYPIRTHSDKKEKEKEKENKKDTRDGAAGPGDPAPTPPEDPEETLRREISEVANMTPSAAKKSLGFMSGQVDLPPELKKALEEKAAE